VTGIEECGGIAGSELSGELELVDDALATEIAAADHLEAETGERIAHCLGVVDGLLQLSFGRQIGVSVIADDERNALLGAYGCADARRRRHDGQQQQPRCRKNTAPLPHDTSAASCRRQCVSDKVLQPAVRD
jgi:hypothetical protein